MTSAPAVTLLSADTGKAATARRLLSFPVMLAAGLTFLTFQVCAPRLDDPDLWWHLQTGNQILAARSIPVSDSFSFTAAGKAWLAQEWLPEAAFAGILQAFGEQGLFALFVATASAIVVLTYWLCCLWSGNSKTSLIGGILILYFLTAGLTLRPALFGLLFLVLELLLLYDWCCARRRYAWALPLLFAIWANSHASFLFGLLLLPTAFVHARPYRAVILTAASVAAVCINPHGLAILVYPLEVMFRQPDNLGNIQEWAPLSLDDPRALGFLAVLVFICLSQIKGGMQLRPVEWLLLATGAAMAIQHVRMLPIFGLLAAPIVCRIVAGWWDGYDPRKDQPLGNAALIAIAIGTCLWQFPPQRDLQQRIAATQPVQAVAAVRRLGLSGPMINDYTWGGYLIWALPEHKVFIDGRADLYAPLGIMSQYKRWALLQEDPALLLHKYAIRFCLIRRSSPVAQALRYMPSWRRVHEDAVAVVYVRIADGDGA